MWHLATLASIIGVLLGVMAVVTSLSMAVPVFEEQRTRDAMMVGFMGLPILQVGLVTVGTLMDEAHPGTAIRLYALAVLFLAVLLVMPALWGFADVCNGWKAATKRNKASVAASQIGFARLRAQLRHHRVGGSHEHGVRREAQLASLPPNGCLPGRKIRACG